MMIHFSETMIATAAAAHGIAAETLAKHMRSNGWDFSPMDINDTQAVAFVAACLNTHAAKIAERAAKIARAREVEAAQRLAAMTQDAKSNSDRVCGKCDGKGRICGFDHYAGGVCFQCNGSGVIRVRKAA